MASIDTHAWQAMHPPLQPWRRAHLDVGDGHQVYFEQCGHPGAPVVLVLHGGPGTGCAPEDRRWFDPRRWQVVLMDQRGAGRSKAVEALRANTTAHLLSDIEILRRHLGIDRWALFGGSWGASLALAYAQAFPARVQGLVLRGVFMATHAERCWLYGPRGAALRHPAAWLRLCEAAGQKCGETLLDALEDRLCGPDDAAALRAAGAWWQWEDDLMQAEVTGPAPGRPQAPDPATLLNSARIGVHYARHGWFMDEGRLLRDLPSMQALPGFIVQGERDLVTPPATARLLHARWGGSHWCGVPAAGHASTHPAMARHLVRAVDALADHIASQAAAPASFHPSLETAHAGHHPAG